MISPHSLDTYDRFCDSPTQKAQLSRDSIYFLNRVGKLVEDDQKFWEARSKGFSIKHLCYENRATFLNDVDADYQIAINGFFQDMWLTSSACLSESHKKEIWKTAILFAERFGEATTAYKIVCDTEYDIPLFCTMAIRLMQGMPSTQEESKAMEAFESLSMEIHTGNQKHIEKAFATLTSAIHVFAARAIISIGG